MKLEFALTALGEGPVGMTSLIHAVRTGDMVSIGRKLADRNTPLEAAEARLKELREQQNTCGSDAAWWGYMGEISYWQAVRDILEAAQLVGPDNLLDTQPPKREGVVMDLCAEQERFGRRILEAARRHAEATKAHPEADGKAVELSMTREQIHEICGPLMKHMSDVQQQGKYSRTQIVAAAGYAIGVAMGASGFLLIEDGKISEHLPNLWEGYKNGRGEALEKRRGKAH